MLELSQDKALAYAERYARWTAWLRERPERVRTMKLAGETVPKYACYAAFPLLLALIWLGGDLALLVRTLLVAAGGFAACTALRVAVAEPRPYEACPIQQLVEKDTHGKSFPSRHIFSIFVIAMCWLRFCAPVGALLLLAGAGMAVVRVLGGVHYPHDVVAGALLGMACGTLLWV